MAETIDELIEDNHATTLRPEVNHWEEDAILDPAIRAATLPADFSAGLLLTGATGFLGTHLLVDLLQQTRATIYCLVRATTPESALSKLEQQLHRYQLSLSSQDMGRLVVVPGDLALPRLGLSQAEFEQLAYQVSFIYHNGASVNVVAPYHILREANVLGTQEILRLAATRGIKPVHYVSTLSVLASAPPSGEPLSEQSPLEAQRQWLHSGYGQSKWAAETLIQQANQRGIPTCIYRPGRISGHARTGAWNQDDYLYRLIRGCILLGMVPDVEKAIDMTPVDYISQAIIHLSGRAAAPGKAFHLFNPISLTIRELMTAIRSFGYDLQQVPYELWREHLLQETQEQSDHPLASLLLFFPDTQGEEELPFAVRLSATNAQQGLADMARAYPAPTEELIHRYLTYMVENNHLPSPSQGKEQVQQSYRT